MFMLTSKAGEEIEQLSQKRTRPIVKRMDQTLQKKKTKRRHGNMISGAYLETLSTSCYVYARREESFPIPFKYIDVIRHTQTNLDIQQEHKIVNWNVDSHTHTQTIIGMSTVNDSYLDPG